MFATLQSMLKSAFSTFNNNGQRQLGVAAALAAGLLFVGSQHAIAATVTVSETTPSSNILASYDNGTAGTDVSDYSNHPTGAPNNGYGESFSVASHSALTDFVVRANGSGGISGNTGASFFQITLGTVSGSTFTPTYTETTPIVDDSVITGATALKIYDFAFSTPQTLNAGTTYAVTISTNFPGAPDNGDHSFIPLSALDGNPYAGGTEIDGYTTNASNDLVFYALGGGYAVPEPASLSLLGLGAAGLLSRRRRASK